MKTKLLILSIAALCLSAAPVLADIFPTGPMTFGPGSPSEDSLQEVLDGITVSPNLGDSSTDTTQDAILDTWDSYWEITASGSSAATMIVELSAWNGLSTFGVYDPTNSSNKATIFEPSDFPGLVNGGVAYLAIEDDGDVYVNLVYQTTFADTAQQYFGFFFTSPDGTSYSDTSLNVDGLDHMVAYQGGNNATSTVDEVAFAGFSGDWTDNEFILGFEDQMYTNGPSGSPWPGDGDYQDLVLMIESVQPVPVPGAVLLGILGLSVAGIKLRRFA